MRVLCITGHDIDLESMKNADCYNGRGWVESLLDALKSVHGLEITVVLLSNQKKDDVALNGVVYTTIWENKKSNLRKLMGYYFSNLYKTQNYDQQLYSILQKYSPDIIHLFGLENPFISILNQCAIPVVTHLQGLLTPINNAFFPVDFNRRSFIFPVSFREWILRNGFIYAKNSIERRAKTEIELFRILKFAMGRTHWDKQIVSLLAPHAKYFHVDEILRAEFYTFAGKWVHPNNKKITLVSTISETIYKGLDLILKTARILSLHTHIVFEWKIIGMNKQDRLVRFFEKHLSITSDDVHITYHGVKSANEICELLLNSNIYIHPSYIENSPNSICEAQMIGVPVIATNVGGVCTLIEHNATGILVPANAPYELCSHIAKLASDKKQCLHLSVQSVEVATKRHNKDKVLNDLINCYQQVTNAN